MSRVAAERRGSDQNQPSDREADTNQIVIGKLRAAAALVGMLLTGGGALADLSEPQAGFGHLQRYLHRGFTTQRAPLLESAIQEALDVPQEIPD